MIAQTKPIFQAPLGQRNRLKPTPNASRYATLSQARLGYLLVGDGHYERSAIFTVAWRTQIEYNESHVAK